MENFHEINVENLLYKIEKFYKQFYFNRLIRGFIFFLAIILSVFLLFDFIFYYSDLSDIVRFVIFYIFLFTLFSGIYYWIIDPILRLFRINRGLTLEEASEYIGGYYNEIGDKLLNTVQFYNSSKRDSLMVAAMNQRAGVLTEFDFRKAVPTIRSNKFVVYALIPITFFIGILIFNSKVITEGSNRLINYDINYAKIAPFSINVLNPNVKVIRGDDVRIEVNIVGEDLPSELDIVLDGALFRMNRTGNNTFNYLLKDIYDDVDYSIKAGKYFSEEFTIEIVEDIVIKNIVARIRFPEYLGKSDIDVSNPSLLNIPYGSKVMWSIELNKGTNASLIWNAEQNQLNIDEDGNGQFEKNVFEDVSYSLNLLNGLGNNKTGFIGDIDVIIDKYPLILIKSELSKDGNESIYFGKIQDDYGFSNLRVKLTMNDSTWFEVLDFSKTSENDVFSYVLDNSRYSESLEISFIVWDNDELNGFKKSESEIYFIEVLTDDEKSVELEDTRNELIKELDDVIEETRDFDDEIRDLRKDLLNKRDMDWESERKMEEMLKDGKEREERIKSINDRLKDYQEERNHLNRKIDKELMDKQNQLNDLFEKLMDEESKKLLRELQELLDQMDKKKIQEHLEKMEMNNEDLKKELDKNLEIFKELEFERDFEKVMDDLERLAEEQNKLSEETLNSKNEEGLEEKQDSLNKSFDKLKEDMKKLDSLNNELKDPNDMKIDSAGLENISNEQDDAKENLSKKNYKKSSENQKNASDQMKKMKKSLESGLDMESSEQASEDLDELRKILENLLVLSFEQEELMMELKSMDRNDPRVVGINQDQKDMIESSNMVKDSLMALGVRVFQLNDLIQDEVGTVTREMNSSVLELQERRFSETLMHQQKSLTSINNLAVLLDEVIQQMQEQQNQQKESNGSCSKPGQGKPKPSMKSSKMKQKDLAKKIEQLKKELEKGNKPGKMNPGKVGSGLSKEIAEMAAQQEMIRREVQKMADELKKEGNLGGAGELKKLEELLEQNEEDIINFDLDNEFFRRQQDIEVKMLEAENAKRKRDQDNKRESEESNNINLNKDLELDLYKLEKEFELELLRIFNPSLTNYYKSQVQLYNLNSK